jgi:hypothetical protein
LLRALTAGVAAGQLPASADLDALVSMLIGSFYARYLLSSDLPADWAERTLQAACPNPPAGDEEN